MLEREWVPSAGRLRYGEVPWDTEAFGFPVYQLSVAEGYPGLSNDLASLLTHVSPSRGDPVLTFAKIPSTDIELLIALVENGFYPVETQIEAYASLAKFTWERRFQGLRLRPAKPVDVPAVSRLARTAFRLDRYHLDPNLSDEQAGRRMERWLAQGIERGDIVMVFEDDAGSRTIGFCHLQKHDDRLIDFVLGAIDSRWQGAGIGLLMYGECFLECRERGFRNVVTRISLHNADVLNVFAELGCRFRHPRLTMHRFSPPRPAVSGLS